MHARAPEVCRFTKLVHSGIELAMLQAIAQVREGRIGSYLREYAEATCNSTQ